MTEHRIEEFKKTVWQYYHHHKRHFPWRETTNSYYIFVSEVMLQQTQTLRVVDKFLHFISVFPGWTALAKANSRDVIAAWQGLGYNRRALYLHESAKIVIQKHQGNLPADVSLVDALPGIGYATASSICAFAFNMPTVFIETNIRAVFIHEFFNEQAKVHDNELIPLLEQAVDKENPREWYYALMDYGVMLKKAFKNPSRKSVQYTKQSAFEGSDRQIRGIILRTLITYPIATEEEIIHLISREPRRIQKNLENLLKEGLIKKNNDSFFL